MPRTCFAEPQFNFFSPEIVSRKREKCFSGFVEQTLKNKCFPKKSGSPPPPPAAPAIMSVHAPKRLPQAPLNRHSLPLEGPPNGARTVGSWREGTDGRPPPGVANEVDGRPRAGGRLARVGSVVDYIFKRYASTLLTHDFVITEVPHIRGNSKSNRPCPPRLNLEHRLSNLSGLSTFLQPPHKVLCVPSGSYSWQKNQTNSHQGIR